MRNKEPEPGIFYTNSEKDCDLLSRIFKTICEDWNQRYSELAKFRLTFEPEGAKAASNFGGAMLKYENEFQAFPASPNAFKCVAALLISICTFPVINGRNVRDDGQEYVAGNHTKRMFFAGLYTEALPLIFSPIDQFGEGGKRIPLKHWGYYPNMRLKDDLRNFLHWVINAQIKVHDQNNLPRLQRMVYLLSILLEAIFYFSPEDTPEVGG